ncbi:MAG: aminomethyltransferase beta-barrel domain-containing protein, partial [Chloroflexota bacterium]
ANVIQLGRRADLERRTLDVTGLSLIDGRPPDGPFRALVRVRHRAPLVAGSVVPAAAGVWRIDLDHVVWAPAPGQAAVLYDPAEPQRVLGGGRIDEPAWRG